MQPDQIGRYCITGKVAQGGMATVFLADDPQYERQVALKVLPSPHLQDPALRARFEREGRIIASLDNSAIVPLFDFGESDGVLYIVMRYMAGGSLGDRLERGPMLLDEAFPIIDRLATALDDVHSHQIVHRDLKPSNILFDQRGDAYLADFGIAKLVEATVMYTGSSLIGTPAYMSPEQFYGNEQIDGRSDIYALGAILFEMLTGQQPFPADSPANYMLGHIMTPVPMASSVALGLPAGIDTITSKALAKEPAERYATARDLAYDLKLLMAGRTPRASVEQHLAGKKSMLQPANPQPTINFPRIPSMLQPIAQTEIDLSRWVPGVDRSYSLLTYLSIIFVGAFVCGIVALAALNLGGDAGTDVAAASGVEVVTIVATQTPAGATAAAMVAQSNDDAYVPTQVIADVTITLAPTVAPIMVAIGTLSVFEEPRFDSRILFLLQPDEEAVIIGRLDDENWLQIEALNGRTGWIAFDAENVSLVTGADDLALLASATPTAPQPIVSSPTVASTDAPLVATSTPLPPSPPATNPPPTATALPTNTPLPPTATSTSTPSFIVLTPTKARDK